MKKLTANQITEYAVDQIQEMIDQMIDSEATEEIQDIINMEDVNVRAIAEEMVAEEIGTMPTDRVIATATKQIIAIAHGIAEDITGNTPDPTDTNTTEDTTENDADIPQGIVRANRVTVKADGDEFIADFYKTHKHITTVRSEDLLVTQWARHDITDKNTTRSMLREDFRAYVIENAQGYGIEWKPEDMRMECNKRKARYETDNDVYDDVHSMIEGDVANMIAKMPWADNMERYNITVDSITPMTHTAKGTELIQLGILDGKYANGNWAWADIEVTVEISFYWDKFGRDSEGTFQIYQILPVQMVSGQLKKFKMSQTTWNDQIKVSLGEVGITVEDKESK